MRESFPGCILLRQSCTRPKDFLPLGRRGTMSNVQSNLAIKPTKGTWQKRGFLENVSGLFAIEILPHIEVKFFKQYVLGRRSRLIWGFRAGWKTGMGGENQGKMRLTTLYNHFQPCYDHWCLQSVLCWFILQYIPLVCLSWIYCITVQCIPLQLSWIAFPRLVVTNMGWEEKIETRPQLGGWEDLPAKS